jgi:hypothetical protein
MPRPRTPLAKARLTGADRKDPSRFAARAEPALSGRGIGLAPEYLSPSGRKAWATFTDELPWLMHEDRAILEVAATLRGRIADEPATASAALLGQYRLFLAALGATPVDRSKVGYRAPEDDDPFAFLSRQ